MRISPLTVQGIDYVLDNLSEQGRREAQVFGQTVQDLKDRFYKANLFNLAFYDDAGTCCVIIYLEPLAFQKWRTHFAATDEGFKKIGFQLTRFLEKFSTDMVKKGHEIEVVSLLGNGKYLNWFSLLGFKLAETQGKICKFVKGG